MKNWLSCILVLFALLFCGSCGNGKTEPQSTVNRVSSTKVVVAGSGSNIKLTRRLAAEYFRQSGRQIEIPGSIGTTGAVRAVRQDAIPMGLASRPLTSEEMAQGLKQIPYASIGLAIAVHVAIPENNLKEEDLIQIYGGEKKTWNNGTPIDALCMYENDSTNTVLTNGIPDFSVALKEALSRQDWHITYSDGAMLTTLLNTPQGIGFIDAAALAENGDRLKALNFNGVTMNGDNLRTGRYPLKKDLFFIYTDNLSDEAKQFVDFCRSEPGRRVILENGAIPVGGSSTR